MISISAKIRKDIGKKVNALRKKGILPAVLYGPKLKSIPIELDLKEFEKAYAAAGESSLVSLEADGKKFLVLIHDSVRDPLTGNLLHVDFYQPDLEKEVEAKVPIIFEGVSPAVKDLGGTFVRNISEIEVRALPPKLPKEIKVNIAKLKTFEDHILVKDLPVEEGVKLLKEPEEIVAYVAQPEKVEEELEKPIEEEVEEVEEVEKPLKESSSDGGSEG